MAALAILIAVPATLLIRGGGDSVPSTNSRGGLAADGPLVRGGLGTSYTLPPGWKSETHHGEIDLTSPDGATGVTITAPAPAGQSTGVLNDAFAKLDAGAKSFDTLQPVAKQHLGGITGSGATVEIVNGDGAKVRVLLSALDGRHRTYLVQAFSAGGGASLPEAQVLLNSLRLGG